jgi:hypothetical protein
LKEASKKGPIKVMSMCGGEKIRPAALSAVVVKGVTRYSPGGTCENPAQSNIDFLRMKGKEVGSHLGKQRLKLWIKMLT